MQEKKVSGISESWFSAYLKLTSSDFFAFSKIQITITELVMDTVRTFLPSSDF